MEWQQRQLTIRQSNIKWALKVLFVGDEGVGKTRLMCDVSDGVYIDGLRTKVGSSFGARRFNMDPARVQLQIWNLTDKEGYEKLRRQFYRGSGGVVFVFNLSDRSSFDNISKWVEDVRSVLGDVPAILVGNRMDKKERRTITKREAKQLAKHLRMPYIETSPDFNPLFDRALQDLVAGILENH